MPLASVVTVAEPPNVTEAPLPGAANVTAAPETGLLNASRTIAWNGAAYSAPASSTWPFPLSAVMVVADPGVIFENWTLTVSGAVQKPGEYTLAQVQALPRIRQNTRHICVEGWDAITHH